MAVMLETVYSVPVNEQYKIIYCDTFAGAQEGEVEWGGGTGRRKDIA